jgi:hypothetical protein
MRTTGCRFRDCQLAFVTAWLLGLLAASAPRAEDAGEPMVARTNQPLDLLLTQAELRSLIRSYENRTGNIVTAPIDEEVLVTAPGEQAPMREPSRDVARGIAAPFWAIANPSQSWRIFMPIPPKGLPKEEAPLPDPR